MKKLITAVVLSVVVCTVNAQVGLGVTTPHPNAYFQINSTTKGVLLPRMTTLQRFAIAPAASANGLLVYDTDSSAYMYWDGGNWQKMNTAYNTEKWKQNGNDIYNDNAGNVGIGNATPVSPLSFASTTGDKIALWGNDAGNNYGIGIQGGLLQIHTAFAVDNIAFGSGSSNNFTESMRIQGDGKVGIGVSDPGYFLDVAGRMRIRSGGDITNTSGLWLNDIGNTASPAFIGMESDNTVGFYGSGSGWGLTMNTNSGKIKISDGTQAAGRILSCDANGTASWVNSSAITSAVYGFFPGSGANLTTAQGAYINAYIDLPPGKWIVFANYLLSQGGTGGYLLANQSMWVRTSFSSSPAANISTGDIIGSGLMSGSLQSPSNFGLVTGQTIVNNTSGSTKRYYVWASMQNFGGQPVGFALDGIGSAYWGENQLTAIPMN